MNRSDLAHTRRTRTITSKPQVASWRDNRAIAEPLEARRLLATFTVNGTAGNDTISLDIVGANVVITLNGSPQSMSDATVTDIVINGLAGNDTIDVIRNSNNPTTINAGDNDDTIRISPTNQVLSQVTAAVMVNGQNGTDSLTMHDNANLATSSYTITSTTVTTAGMGNVTYGTTENLNLSANNGASTINLNGTAAGTAVTLLGNDGADVITVGVPGNPAAIVSNMVVRGGGQNDTIKIEAMSAAAVLSVASDTGDDTIQIAPTNQRLSEVAGNITIDGLAGSDSLTLHDDANNIVSADFTITSSTVTATGMGALTYTGMETLNLEAGTRADDINVESTLATTSLVVTCISINTSVRISPTNRMLSEVAGPTNVTAMGIVLYNDLNPASATYAITSNLVSATGMGTLTYSPPFGGVSLNLNAGNNDDTINVESSLSVMSLRVNCNGGDDNVAIAPTNQNLDLMNGSVTINGQAGIDSLTLHDNSGASAAYTITSSTVAATGMGTLTYAELESLTLSASNGASTINLIGTAAGTAVTLLGNDGADVITVGVPGNPAAIVSNMVVRGGGQNDTIKIEAMSAAAVLSVASDTGDDSIQIAPTNQVLGHVGGDITIDGVGNNDSMTLFDNANPVAGSYAITSNTVTAPGMDLVYFAFETLTLNCGGGNSTVDVSGSLAGSNFLDPTINTGGGDDVVRLGSPGNNWSDFLGGVTLNSGQGNDAVLILDSQSTIASTYAFDPSLIQRFAPGLAMVLFYSGTESVELECGTAADTILFSFETTGVALSADGGGGNDTINVIDTDPAMPVTINGGAGLDSVSVNTDSSGIDNAVFETAQELAGLTINTGGSLTVATGGNNLLQTNNVAISGTGTLDLNDNDMILNYSGASPLAAIETLISAARNGGDWLGSGITSSSARTHPSQITTLGAVEATDYDSIYGPGALFNGVDPDSTSVLVKYTYYGDADFSGAVDFDDYVRADTGYNTGLTGWLNGDFDYNGTIDFDDYVLIDSAFNLQGAAL